MKKLKKILPYILIMILVLPAARSLLAPGYFSMHDDLQVMRIYQMEKCFADGQIPCRWSPDMAAGFGQAMFNYYSAFPYYLGAFIRVITPLSIMATVRLLFLISLLASAFGMYRLAREFWGVLGAVVSSFFYTYAPYHALDVYVRGALAESFALAILPFVWLCFYLLIKKPTYTRVIGTAVSVFALFTTHNISTLIFAPFTIFWVVYWVIQQKKWKGVIWVSLSGLLGFGLSSFFLIPVLLERSLIQDAFFTQDYFFYASHFTSIKQLFFDRSWGYGPSTFGPNDDLSFQIGWPHWWLGIPSFILALFWLKKGRSEAKLLLSLLILSGLAAFMTHARSNFIWKSMPTLSFVQFPWRFLGLVIFFLSFALGALACLNFRLGKAFAIFLIFISIGLNLGFFKPKWQFPQDTDENKLSGANLEVQQRSANLDYLPKSVEEMPVDLAPDLPEVVKGNAQVSKLNRRSSVWHFDTDVFSQDGATVNVPIFDFPTWQVLVDGKEIEHSIATPRGVIEVQVPTGKHIVVGWFKNTPIRAIANALTLVSFASIVLLIILRDRYEKNI